MAEAVASTSQEPEQSDIATTMDDETLFLKFNENLSQKQLSCGFCIKNKRMISFKTKQDCYIHIEKNHGYIVGYTCSECNIIYPSRAEFLAHECTDAAEQRQIPKNNGTKFYVCVNCSHTRRATACDEFDDDDMDFFKHHAPQNVVMLLVMSDKEFSGNPVISVMANLETDISIFSQTGRRRMLSCYLCKQLTFKNSREKRTHILKEHIKNGIQIHFLNLKLQGIQNYQFVPVSKFLCPVSEVTTAQPYLIEPVLAQENEQVSNIAVNPNTIIPTIPVTDEMAEEYGIRELYEKTSGLQIAKTFFLSDTDTDDMSFENIRIYTTEENRQHLANKERITFELADVPFVEYRKEIVYSSKHKLILNGKKVIEKYLEPDCDYTMSIISSCKKPPNHQIRCYLCEEKVCSINGLQGHLFSAHNLISKIENQDDTDDENENSEELGLEERIERASKKKVEYMSDDEDLADIILNPYKPRPRSELNKKTIATDEPMDIGEKQTPSGSMSAVGKTSTSQAIRGEDNAVRKHQIVSNGIQAKRLKLTNDNGDCIMIAKMNKNCDSEKANKNNGRLAAETTVSIEPTSSNPSSKAKKSDKKIEGSAQHRKSSTDSDKTKQQPSVSNREQTIVFNVTNRKNQELEQLNNQAQVAGLGFSETQSLEVFISQETEKKKKPAKVITDAPDDFWPTMLPPSTTKKSIKKVSTAKPSPPVKTRSNYYEMQKINIDDRDMEEVVQCPDFYTLKKSNLKKQSNATISIHPFIELESGTFNKQEMEIGQLCFYFEAMLHVRHQIESPQYMYFKIPSSVPLEPYIKPQTEVNLNLKAIRDFHSYIIHIMKHDPTRICIICGSTNTDEHNIIKSNRIQYFLIKYISYHFDEMKTNPSDEAVIVPVFIYYFMLKKNICYEMGINPEHYVYCRSHITQDVDPNSSISFSFQKVILPQTEYANLVSMYNYSLNDIREPRKQTVLSFCDMWNKVAEWDVNEREVNWRNQSLPQLKNCKLCAVYHNDNALPKVMLLKIHNRPPRTWCRWLLYQMISDPSFVGTEKSAEPREIKFLMSQYKISMCLLHFSPFHYNLHENDDDEFEFRFDPNVSITANNDSIVRPLHDVTRMPSVNYLETRKAFYDLIKAIGCQEEDVKVRLAFEHYREMFRCVCCLQLMKSNMDIVRHTMHAKKRSVTCHICYETFFIPSMTDLEGVVKNHFKAHKKPARLAGEKFMCEVDGCQRMTNKMNGHEFDCGKHGNKMTITCTGLRALADSNGSALSGPVKACKTCDYVGESEKHSFYHLADAIIYCNICLMEFKRSPKIYEEFLEHFKDHITTKPNCNSWCGSCNCEANSLHYDEHFTVEIVRKLSNVYDEKREEKEKLKAKNCWSV